MAFRLIFITFCAALLTLLVPSTALAQGTYSCVWHGVTASGDNCTFGVNSCHTDYVPPNDACKGLSSIPFLCKSANTCIPSSSTSNQLTCIASDGTDGINTALGCLSTDARYGGFVGDILRLSVALGGGIALLIIIYGIFTITTSAGIPDKIKAGQDLITSAVTGLIFIVFSLVLLNIIGVQLLAIPGL